MLAILFETDLVGGLAGFRLAIDILDGIGAGMDEDFVAEFDGELFKADFLRVSGQNKSATTQGGE